MFIADNFFLHLWLILRNIHFLHQFHHFLVRLQLAYFEVGFFFAGGTFGQFILRIAFNTIITETVSTTLESIGDAVEQVEFLGAGVTVHF
jgi:hypothetical protein